MTIPAYIPFAIFTGPVNYSYRSYLDPTGKLPTPVDPPPDPDVCVIDNRFFNFTNMVHVAFLNTVGGLWSGDRGLPYAVASMGSGYDTGTGMYMATYPGGGEDGQVAITFFGSGGGNAPASFNWLSGKFQNVNVDVGLHVAVQSTGEYWLSVDGGVEPFRAYLMPYIVWNADDPDIVAIPDPEDVLGIEEGQPWTYSESTRNSRRWVWIHDGETLTLWETVTEFPPDFDYDNEPFDTMIGGYIQDVTSQYEDGILTVNSIFEQNGLPTTTVKKVAYGMDFMITGAAASLYTVTLNGRNIGLRYLCEPIPE